MAWLVGSLVHGVICIVAVADLSARAMSPVTRGGWLAAVLLLPAVGAAAYAVWVMRGGADGPEGWGDDA
jgi:hypothetical protein